MSEKVEVLANLEIYLEDLRVCIARITSVIGTLREDLEKEEKK